MDKIGIMQGRVLPERLDHLQIFPISNWREEIFKVDEIGFDSIELLFDKELFLSNLLKDLDNLKSLRIKSTNKVNDFTARSICVDYLSSISILNSDTEHVFQEIIVKLIDVAKSTTIDVLVIPFFDTNLITSKQELGLVLAWMEERKLDNIASESNVILALELSLPASQIRSAFMEHSFNNIAICYDLGNARAVGYLPEEEISVLFDLISHVHIKDKKIDGLNVMLGDGDVDMLACLMALKEIGYDGQLVLETAYENSPIVEADINLQFIKKILNNIFS